ncbi:MAG: hypothetical protein E2O68_07350 [Deltaproteobacteria bacterium]|nr:MAG: hypothetical protein E2O68_07350 [Deltaproteobacteria bacterium]
MLIPILLGLLTGYIMCIPIGPLNILVFNTKLKRGMAPAMAIAIGGAIMDFIYFFIILSGLSLFTINPQVTYGFQIFGTVILFILGIKEIFFVHVDLRERPKYNKKFGSKSFLLLGILIYVGNPTMFFSLSTLCAFIKSFAFFPSTLANNAIFSLFVALGSILWFYTLVVIIEKFEHKITKPLMIRINQFCGILIVFLSFYLGFKTLT